MRYVLLTRKHYSIWIIREQSDNLNDLKTIMKTLPPEVKTHVVDTWRR